MTSPLVELVAAIRTHLLADVSVSTFIDDRVYDGVQSGEVSYPNISFGQITSIPDASDCIDGIDATVQVDVWSDAVDGKLEAMNLTDAVELSLDQLDLELSHNALVSLDVEFTQVDFNAVTGKSHGVVRVGAFLERS